MCSLESDGIPSSQRWPEERIDRSRHRGDSGGHSSCVSLMTTRACVVFRWERNRAHGFVTGKPGMSRDDLFKINAGIVRDLAKGCAEFCPKAFILVISNPVNSTVPIAAEILKSQNVFDARRLFGVTTLDVVRAETFVAEILGEKNPQNLTIPVVGGHSGETIVPLFSQTKSGSKIPEDKLDALVNREWTMMFGRQSGKF